MVTRRAPIAGGQLAPRLRAGMAEAQLQEHVRRAAQLGHWLYYHTHRAEHSPAGFLDVVCIRGDQLVVAELKRDGRDLTPAQREWFDAWRILEALMPDHIHVFVWRPSDLDQIDTVLLGKRPAARPRPG